MIMQSLEERVVQAQRQPHDFIIVMSEDLRGTDGVSKAALELNTGVDHRTLSPYIDYLTKKGLVTVNETRHVHYVGLTELGKEIPLEPEQFADFRYGSGKKTEIQALQDIADVIYRYGGTATKREISTGASLGSLRRIRLLDHMIKEGYIEERIAREPKYGHNEEYMLTQAGLSKFPDPGSRIQRRAITSGLGEMLTRVVEAAYNGAERTGLRYITSYGTAQLDTSIGILAQFNLLSESDGIFHITERYDNLDKEALPYALDKLLREENILQKKTRHLSELQLLEQLSEPRNAAYFTKSGMDDLILKKILEALKQRGYITSDREENVRYQRQHYQRTLLGYDFMQRVNATVEQLKAIAQRN